MPPSSTTELLGARRNLTMPGICATVAEQIEALRRVAGDKAVKLIRREPDPTIMRIVEGWPQNFDPRRAPALGFRADSSFDDIIRIHLAGRARKKRSTSSSSRVRAIGGRLCQMRRP